MPNVDIKQTIVTDSEIKTDMQVEYFRSIVKETDVYNCTIILSNGFHALGSVEKTYRNPPLSDAEGFATARLRAINVVAMHGYTLV